MYYKRFIKNSIAQLLSSLTPIIFCFFVGAVVSSELSSVFSLTYPIQFVFMLVSDLFLYSGFTYAKKDKEEQSNDYMLSLVFITFTIMFAIILAMVPLFKYYCIFMHFDLNIFYKWGLLFAIYICSDIGVNAIRLYFVFTKKDKQASICSLNKSLFIILPVEIVVFFTKDPIISLISYIILQIIWYIVYLCKIYKPFKFKFSFYCLKYGIPNTVDNIGMIIFFAFGIESIAEKSLAFVIAYNLDTLLCDWLWDIKIQGIGPIIRSELCSDNFDYKECKKQYRVAYMCVVLVHLLSVICALFILDVDKSIFIKCSLISLMYLLIHSFYIIEQELILTHGYEKLYGIITLFEYIIKILVAISPFIWLFISFGLIFNIITKIFTIIIWQKEKIDILNLYKII